jgi:RNA recognition motif-containing protein
MNINILNLSDADLNWLLWGGVLVAMVLIWIGARSKRMLIQVHQKLNNTNVELKRLNNYLVALLNNSGIDVNDSEDLDETKLYVGNIDYAASETELATHFSKYGQIDMVNIPTDRYTGRARGFGFVTFKKAADALKAMGLDGSEFKGRQIQVNFARERATS